MIDLLGLIWKFLLVQPMDHYLRLVPWHLLTLLILLGVLSGFGLHFLIGYVFRLYRRKERMAWWLSYPSLIVNLVLMQGLLGGYLLGTQAESLVGMNLSEEIAGRMGSLLLEPAFAHPMLAGAQEIEVDKSAIQSAMANLPEAEYRERLLSFIEESGPMRQGSGTDAGAFSAREGQGGGLAENRGGNRVGNSGGSMPAETILLQIGLRWVTSPHQIWLSPLNPALGKEGEEAQEAEELFFLPDFLGSLINELPSGAKLPRADWEHVAGTRFIGGILQPLMVEYLSYLIWALISLLVLLAAIYFYLLRKLGRIGARPPASGTEEAEEEKESPALASADPELLPEASPAEESPPAVVEEPPPKKRRRILFRKSKRKKSDEAPVKSDPSPDPAADSKQDPTAAEEKPA